MGFMKFPALARRDQQTLAVILTACLPLLGWSLYQTVPLGKATPRSYRFHVDLDNAAAVELRLLHGIGEKLADAIVRDRTERGPFKIPADLKRVKGIGPKKFEAVEPFIRCSSP